MNNTFELLFRDFYQKMDELYYKISTKTPLDAEYQNIKKYMEIIIPIFNRISTTPDEYLTLEQILNDNTNCDNTNCDNTNCDNTNCDMDTSAPYSFQLTPDSVEDSTDEEGDIMVNEFNVKALVLLKKYCEYNWLSIDEDSYEKTH